MLPNPELFFDCKNTSLASLRGDVRTFCAMQRMACAVLVRCACMTTNECYMTHKNRKSGADTRSGDINIRERERERERERDLAFSYKYNKARMINGDIKFFYSDHPLIMVAQDNNILCRTQDSNIHDRTKDKIMEDRLFGAVAINIFSKFRIITDIRIPICSYPRQ